MGSFILALTLFSSNPIELVHPVNPTLARRGHSTTVAWVKTGEKKIYVASWSDSYIGFTKGDREATINFLAAIAHEDFHINNGPDEGPAYDEQIRVLKNLGASEKSIKKIEKARKFVTGR